MKIPRQILIILSAVVGFIFIVILVGSFQQEQIQGDLELYQSNLLLQASEYKFKDFKPEGVSYLRQSLFGKDLYKTTIKQYQQAIDSNIKARNKAENKNENIQATDKLYLSLGILESQQGQNKEAIENWSKIKDSKKYSNLARSFSDLKNTDKSVDLEQKINQNLKGWFRYSALKSLYKQQNRLEDLNLLEIQQQHDAQNALFKLIVISIAPIAGIILGIGILATMILGWVRNGPPSFSNWQVSWNWEIILQVFVIGFFLLSQGVVLAFSPLLLKAFSLIAPENDLLLQSIRVLITYFLMATVGLGFLYFSLKPYLPLDSQWFKFDLKSNWIGQAIAGYLVALPLVVLVSLLNQQIWQGQGGSNPLLFLAIEAQNGWVIFIFFITAALAAPFYEEILFRGFLLPSLTAYMSTWKAILLSAVIFALAHLNLSEVLPLSVLGIILGFVYQRNRNLLASMLLHSLWNSGTLLSLFLLGNS